MRKILMFFAAILCMAGCREIETELIFDALPEERMAERLAELQGKLLEPETGWVATLPTSAGGGYGFYMKFNEDQTVDMYADMSDDRATDKSTSTYRIKWVMDASLIFDTYNYLSLLQDPVPSVFGGAAGSGFQSDIEFEYIRSTEDSLILRGKKYQNQLTLVKATAEQQGVYESGGYADAINKLKDFFTNTANPYIEISAEGTTLQAGISMDYTNTMSSGKRLSMVGLLADESVNSVTAKFAFTADGAEILADGLVYAGVTFVRIRWVDDTTLALYDVAGNEYILLSSPAPLLPLTSLFAYNGAYNAIVVEGPVLPSGITSEFNTTWQNNITFYANNNATLEYMRFSLVNGTTARLSVGFRLSGTVYISQAEYSYTYVGNVITLSNPPTSTNGNYNNGWLQAAMKNYFIGAAFTLDYVVSSDPDVFNIAGLYRVDNPNSFFYGKLAKL